MRYSIIIPVYNAEEYLDECIASVLCQEISDWELILIDDGSTDNSSAIVDVYVEKDHRIKVIHKENEGQLYARRDGFKVARGDYIICLDSDDYWEPSCLSVLDTYIEESSPDMIMFPCQIVGDISKNGTVVGAYSDKLEYAEKKSLYEQIISSHLLNSMSLKAFKRELLKDDQTDYTQFMKKSFGEDKLQTLHIFTKAESVLYIPTVLYNYRKNPSGVSNSVDFTFIPSMIGNDLFNILYKYMKIWDMCDTKYIRKYNTYYLKNYISVVYNVRKKCKENGQTKEFKKYRINRLFSTRLKIKSNNDLTLKEKIKAVLAVHFSWIL